jgi:putative ABC transport system permease protein
MNMGWLAAIMIAVAFACGLVAGIYPVMLLMSIQPMATVRISKTFSFVRRESPFNLKRVMVTLQFCISIIFVGSAVVVYQQFRYLGEKNLGMQRDQVVAIPGVPDNVKANFITFKNMVTQVPGIVGVAACMEVPSREIRDAGPVLVKGVNDDPAMAPNMDIQIIDHDFVNLLGIGFIAGGNIPESLLDDGLASDSTMSAENYLFNKRRAYLINETAMRRLGWQSPEDAIGQLINWSIGTFTLDYGPIVGVVRDFHQETLKNNVDPIVMVYEPVWLRTFLIKVKPDDMESYIQSIQATWDKLFPLYPMEYYFLDDLYENLYQSERVQLKLLYLFSGLAIIIAFIGLVGLTTYALKTRTKEIAIRKVMGASIPDLIRLIGREYLLVLLIGGSLAIPVSIYFLRQWLSTFAYRVDISPFTYLMTLSIAGLLLVVTISLQTFRSASASPADTLRDE